MNTGQSLLSIGAFLLLGIIILRINNSVSSTDNTVLNSKFDILGISLAASLLQEANAKAFDQATAGNSISDINLLTAPGSLNPESGESFSNFNDFDDFNNYDTTITNLPSADFHLHCTISYVDPATPSVNVNFKTWDKKITIYVTSTSTVDTIKIESVFSYFYFR